MLNAINRASGGFRKLKAAMDEVKTVMSVAGFKGCLECGAELGQDGLAHSHGCSGLQLTPGLMVVPLPGSGGGTRVVDIGGPSSLGVKPEPQQLAKAVPWTLQPTTIIPIRPAASYAKGEREAVLLDGADLIEAPVDIQALVQFLGAHGEVEMRPTGFSREFLVRIDRLYPAERARVLSWLASIRPEPAPKSPPKPPENVELVGDRSVELEEGTS